MANENDPKIPEIYYECGRKAYWVKLPSGIFLEQDSRDIARRLRACGYSTERADDAISQIEQVIEHTQDHRHVHYAGPLAGFRIGRYELNGFKVLVTAEPQGLWTPWKGKRPTFSKDCPAISRFLGELLGDHSDYLLAWLKVALDSLRGGSWQPGQMLVFAGPSNCGKNFLQFLITQILGGRSANPTRYLLGFTQFNSDLCQAEHLQIADEKAETNIGARRQFGAMVKQMTVNEDVSMHAKGNQAITLAIWRRLTLSCNQEPENLAILPPLDASIIDKIMLFLCGVATLSDDRNANRTKFLSEIPAFREVLRHWKIPDELRTRREEWSRFGCDSWHDPELVEAVSGLSPETHLMNLIDEIIFESKDAPEIWGPQPAQRLESDLLRDQAYRNQVGNLLKFSNSCGTYLSRLERRFPARFISSKSKGVVRWRILKP